LRLSAVPTGTKFIIQNDGPAIQFSAGTRHGFL
jgi:hypothetical protein